jgi:predicted ATPase
MISSLFFANFQALMFPQEIKLAPLTLLVGANSAGKSAIGRSMRFMQQSFEDRFIHFNGNRVDLTSFDQTVSDNNADDLIRLGFGTDESFEIPAEGPLGPEGEELFATFVPEMVCFELAGTETKVAEVNARIRFSVEVRHSGNRADGKARDALPNAGHLGSGSIRFRTVRKHGSEIDVTAELPEGEAFFARWLGDGDSSLRELANALEFKIHFGRKLLPSPLEKTFKSDAAKRVFEILSESISVYSKISTSSQWVGPVRNISSGFQEYRRSGDGGTARAKDSVLSASGDNLQQVALNMAREDFEELSKHLSRLTEGRFELRRIVMNSDAKYVPALGQVFLFDRDKQGDIPVAFKDAGSGISQILPFLILAMGDSYPHVKPSGKVTFVEQPELHLHPRMQAELGDFLITATATRGKGERAYRNQIIAETHSEAVIIRLLRRIREGVISPGDVAIVAIDKFEGGGSLAQHCRISGDGSLIDDLPISFTKLRMNDILGLDG